MKCMIVEDEPLAREILETYVEQLPGLELLGSYPDALQALEALQTCNPELLLLDINLPGLSGLSLLRSLDRPPKVIFTTAYPEHAVEGFELDAVDYLLKPFSLERFLKAINKARAAVAVTAPGSEFISIKADKKLYKVKLGDILYIEAWGDYLKVHTREKLLVTKERMKNMQNNLPDSTFVRIHKSYLVPWEGIQYLEGNQIRIDDEMLPIGQSYKQALLERLAHGKP